MTEGLPYQPFYCEENIFQLARGPRVTAPAGALFITNRARAVAMTGQRGGARGQAGDVLVWDYHVVLLTTGGRPEVWDPNSTYGAPVLASGYLNMSFPQGVPQEYRPRFRFVPRAQFLRDFRSDRRHMKTIDGGWLKPPPSWPVAGPGHTLERFLDLDDPWGGQVMSMQELQLALIRRRLGR